MGINRLYLLTSFSSPYVVRSFLCIRYISTTSDELFTSSHYPELTLFKGSVLEQKEKKRMGKWIRQRFFLIAGRLVKSGRRLILKLQEDRLAPLCERIAE